jgi:hypothetical protein
MRTLRILIVPIIVVAVAGCSDRGLRTMVNNDPGPDEFMVLPAKPLTPPESYTFLPPPRPGAGNLTDQNPRGDAVAALGGNAAALNAGGGIPSADAALVRSAGRYGVEGDIRADLAAEDADFRRRRGRLANIRLFNVDRYSEVYRREALDPFDEAARYRGAGAVTPTAPPASN